MSSTYLRLHYHIVFSTKYRQELIDKSWQKLFYINIGNKIKHLNAIPEAIGGLSDHIHLLIGLRSSHCLADVIREIKYHSCRWVHTELKLTNFAWQTGYSAFTVSYSGINAVKNYINNQEIHHKNKSFDYELYQFLQKNNLL
jgi:REP element-mobilizing transposase RayT